MAKINKKSMSDIRGAAMYGGGRGYEKAARDYVNSGLDKLDLLPQQKSELKLKLQKSWTVLLLKTFFNKN